MPSRINWRTLSGGGAGRPALSSLPSIFRQNARALGAERVEQACLVGGEPVDGRPCSRHTPNFSLPRMISWKRSASSWPNTWSDTPSLRRRTAVAISSLYSAVKFFFSSACSSACSDSANLGFDARGRGHRRRRGLRGRRAAGTRRRARTGVGGRSSLRRKENRCRPNADLTRNRMHAESHQHEADYDRCKDAGIHDATLLTHAALRAIRTRRSCSLYSRAQATFAKCCVKPANSPRPSVRPIASFDVVLGMRHQAQHIAALAQNTGNRVGRAVDVPARIELAVGRDVAERAPGPRLPAA